MKDRARNGPLTPGSRGSRDSGGSRDLSEDAAFQFGTQAVSRSPTVRVGLDGINRFPIALPDLGIRIPDPNNSFVD
ncbi:unnamed protein product [Ectocarpus fasciculatus]